MRAGKKQREKQEGERFVKSWERWGKVYIEYFKVKIVLYEDVSEGSTSLYIYIYTHI